MKSVDVVVVGGGIVGCVLAKGLSQSSGLSQTSGLSKRSGLKVALIDSAAPVSSSSLKTKALTKTPVTNDFNPFADTRVIALARRTVQELKALNVQLDKLAEYSFGELPPTIDAIEVSDSGHLGLVNLAASDFHISSFGQVVSLSALTKLVADSNDSYEHVAPAKVVSVKQHVAHTDVTLDNGECYRAKLLVLADGGRSPLAEQVGIGRSESDYGQTAIVFNVHTQLSHSNKAYERFTDSGPLAFLPFDNEIDGEKSSNNGFSVVWTVKSDKAAHLLAMSANEFASALQDAFGYRQGKIEKVSDKSSYPLSLKLASDVTAHRTVIVGNAAQALHPIAGQGFNLGLRDIHTLISVLTRNTTSPSDPGDFSVLHEYASKRSKDRKTTVALTDTLVHTFSNRHFPLVVGRNISLLALGMLSAAKKQFVKQTTGYGLGAK